jgi:hypothetical protein
MPEAFLPGYCSVCSDRQSIETIECIVSTVQGTSAGGTKVLNKFRYNSISHSHRPEFLSFKFDDRILEEILAPKFPSIDFQRVLDELTQKLIKLRCIIYSSKWVHGCPLLIESRAQCIMQLFLADVFLACAPSMEVTAANGDVIDLTVTTHDKSLVNWSGSTDLKCSQIGSTSIKEATATLEMKVPFNRGGLYSTTAMQPKQQLLGYAMGLKELDKSCPFKLSYLTDFFAISVMHYVENKAYISERVTGAKEYCLRLLLMCCDLSSGEWTQLLGVDAHPIALEDINDTVPPPSNIDPSAYCSATARGPVTRSQKKGGGTHEKQVACGTFRCEEEEAHERRLAEYTDVMRWQAKLQGYKYLGFEEMLRHNSIMP